MSSALNLRRPAASWHSPVTLQRTKTSHHQSGEQFTEMCPRCSARLGGGCRYRPPGLVQDLKAQPSSPAEPNKTAILCKMENKGNCYVACEYKYTSGSAMECRSVLFHCTSLNLEVGHTD